MDTQIKIAELLCTRLCHDLAGPISAVNNGAEFLKEDEFNMHGQAVDLIAGSAVEAVTRLQFYRQAYGKANHEGEASMADLKKITEQFFSTSKIVLDWPDAHTDASGVSVSHLAARLILNAIIIVSGSLIRGGTLAIRLTHREGRDEITLSGEGPAVKWEKDIEDAFNGTTHIDDLAPKTIQPYITRKLVEIWKGDMTCHIDGAKIAIKISKAT